MPSLPIYTITEEVVLQTVEVGFRLQPNWQVSFTNPTAGPWKAIRFGDYVGGTDLKYAKEEDRPDLIVFNEKYSLFLILEAKENILRLIVILMSAFFQTSLRDAFFCLFVSGFMNGYHST